MNTQEKYDLWSLDYSDNPINPLMESEHKIITNFVEPIIRGKSVIDAGCGCGRISKLCHKSGAKNIFAFDISNGMLDKFNSIKCFDGIEIVNGNILNIPTKELYDVYISSLVVGHVPDLKRVLSEAKRVVKSGGFIMISDFHPIRAHCGFTRSFNVNQENIQLEHYIHTLEHWIKCINDLELSLIMVKEGYLDDKYNHFDNYKDDPDIDSTHKFQLAFSLPSVWVFYVQKKSSTAS